MRSIRAFAALLTLVVLSSRHDILAAQEPIAPAQAIDDTIEAGEADAKEPAAYGYGSLDRFGLVGKTHFFQTRLQLQL